MNLYLYKILTHFNSNKSLKYLINYTKYVHIISIDKSTRLTLNYV